MTSTPAASSSSAIGGVMPKPPATFSALTTTNVGSWRSRSVGSTSSSVRRPDEPTRSPQKRIRASAGTVAILTEMSTEQRIGGTGVEEPQALEAEHADELPPAPPAPVVIPRGIQLVLLAFGLLMLWIAARAARHVVEIIIIASLIALILNPFVAFLGRRGIRRALAIPITYLTLLVVLAGIGFLLAQPISNQVD